MENTSTPILNNKRRKSHGRNDLTLNNISKNKRVFYNNEDSTKSVSSIFENISPIKKRKIPRLKMADLTGSADESEPFQSCKVYNGNKTWDSNDSSEIEYSSADEFDVLKVKEIIYELSQAVHIYLNKIKHLDIPVEWELPDVLKPENGLYKCTEGQKGPLSPEEISFIKKRLYKFCKEHKINFEEIRVCLSGKVTKFHFPNEIRLRFIQYLCKDYINDRNPLTVYRVISKLGLRKGKFSENEANFLIEMYHNYNGSNLHSVCGLLLNRHRNHIFKKFDRLKKGNHLGSRPSETDLKIKPAELQKLILKNVLNRRSFDLKVLKFRINKKTWVSIGREYYISPAVAKAIYICEILPQIFAEHPLKLNRFYSTLFCRLYRSEWQTWEDVNWNALSDLLFGTGPFFVYTMLRKIVISYVPKEKWKNFKESAEYLYHNVLSRFEEDCEERKEIKLNRIIILDENIN